MTKSCIVRFGKTALNYVDPTRGSPLNIAASAACSHEMTRAAPRDRDKRPIAEIAGARWLGRQLGQMGQSPLLQVLSNRVAVAAHHSSVPPHRFLELSTNPKEQEMLIPC